MIPQEDIERILEAAKIEEVVEAFVPLKRRGANYIGLCPFHDEKTPSFNVNPARGIFKCFGCGKGGDSVSFLMEHNHYTYPEALRWLAQKYGITIHETEETEEEKQAKTEREELYSINEFAQKYFYNNLMSSDEGKAIGLSYFKEREISQTTIDAWGLGYCKQQTDDFSRYALKNGYSEELLIKSGLSLRSERTNSLYDRFHSRVTFPIYNVAGRVLGFSARILTSDKTKAKYVNSPESLIYTKGNVLFGLFLAKNEIAKKDECYLVEGNVDAVMMSQNGVKNVVASSGTALTEHQVRLIKRYTRNVVILYDGDKAGIHATIRATDMFFKEGMNVKTLLFPDGDDPDSFARKHTQDEFQAFLKDNAQNFILYRANLVKQETANDPIKKASLVKEIIHSISLIPDMIERTTYIQQCSRLLDMEERLLNEELSRQIAHNLYEANKTQSKAEPIIQSQDTSSTETVEKLANKVLQPDNDDENQEKAIIKLLLLYGDKKTQQEVVNSDKKIVKETYNAAGYIIAMIASEDIKFNNPLYQQIFNIFLHEYSEKGEPPKQSTFIHHENQEISSFVSSVLINPYSTSPLWESKYNVVIPDLENKHTIDLHIKQTLLHFKLHKIESIIRDLYQQLKNSTEEDPINTLQRIKNYTQQRNHIAQALHIHSK